MGITIDKEALLKGLNDTFQIEKFKKEIADIAVAKGLPGIFKEVLDVAYVAVESGLVIAETALDPNDDLIDQIADWLDDVFDFTGILAFVEAFDGMIFKAVLKAALAFFIAKKIG
jgi:hypothetical protein